MMTNLHRIFAATIAAGIFTMGLSGARAESGPAERAGKAIDQAAATVAKGVSEAAEKTGEALEKAGEKIQQVVRRPQQKEPGQEQQAQ